MNAGERERTLDETHKDILHEYRTWKKILTAAPIPTGCAVRPGRRCRRRIYTTSTDMDEDVCTGEPDQPQRPAPTPPCPCDEKSRASNLLMYSPSLSTLLL